MPGSSRLGQVLTIAIAASRSGTSMMLNPPITSRAAENGPSATTGHRSPESRACPPEWHDGTDMRLSDLLPAEGAADPDGLYDAFVGWVAADGITLYPHQDEAVIDILTGANVIVTTPTGS